LARIYAEEGFEVALDDLVQPQGFEENLAPNLEGLRVVRVSLQPSLEEALRRNGTRTQKPFDPSLLDGVIREMYGVLPNRCRTAGNWLIVDSTHLSVEEPVDRILASEPKRGSARGEDQPRS
jgi:chloramphenicol 3-O-phosphotransferase